LNIDIGILKNGKKISGRIVSIFHDEPPVRKMIRQVSWLGFILLPGLPGILWWITSGFFRFRRPYSSGGCAGLSPDFPFKCVPDL